MEPGPSSDKILGVIWTYSFKKIPQNPKKKKNQTNSTTISQTYMSFKFFQRDYFHSIIYFFILCFIVFVFFHVFFLSFLLIV